MVEIARLVVMRSRGFGFFLAFAILLVAALPFIATSRLPEVALPPFADVPALDPIAFFDGSTEGRGTLYIVTGSSHRIRVTSIGERQDDGSLLLTQEITEGDKPARTRIWQIAPLGDGTYGGSLSDAEGNVSMEVVGNRARIDYRTPGERISQFLVLQSNGTTISNRLDAYKWGLNVARLDETIVKR